MLSCFIKLNPNYKLFTLVANVVSLITLTGYIACPSTATTFAFVDTLETENLLLSPQPEEDPDEEPGKTVPPN